ncbi:MAG TPA: hypothetical protein DHV85_11475 [Candidatus Accumulibacter sp.]|nr:hypothetical protein [Accumulibacter sp.]
MRVDGEFKGSISSGEAQPGTPVIGAQAKGGGKIAVSHAVINGTVAGPW